MVNHFHLLLVHIDASHDLSSCLAFLSFYTRKGDLGTLRATEAPVNLFASTLTILGVNVDQVQISC